MDACHEYVQLVLYQVHLNIYLIIMYVNNMFEEIFCFRKRPFPKTLYPANILCLAQAY